MFDYNDCAEWLRKQSSRLKSSSFSAEIKSTEAPLRSVLLKASSNAFEAELVIWENGHTSMAVFDLAQDSYKIDRHDLVLTSSDYQTSLQPFFDALGNSN